MTCSKEFGMQRNVRYMYVLLSPVVSVGKISYLRNSSRAHTQLDILMGGFQIHLR